MRRFFRDNGLSLVLLVCFLVLLLGQGLAGARVLNQDRVEHGQPPESFAEYLSGSEFLSVTMENWESEFLQMAVYVLLTTFLFQRGSAESKNPDGRPEEVDRDPRLAAHRPDAPWPVRRGGWVLSLYENSLCIALILLFFVSGVAHAMASHAEFNRAELEHGGHTLSMTEYWGSSQLWFESFQNWQSEFLAIAVMVVFSIFLRQRGSPESKPVDAPHAQTGG